MRVTALTLQYVHTRRIGAEVALHAFLTALAERGHDVHVRTVEPTGPATVDGVQVTRFTKPAPAEVADLVVTNSGLALRAARALAGASAPLLVWAHNNQRPALDDIARASARATRGFALLTNTRHMADVYLSTVGVRAAAVLHPPVQHGTPASRPGDAVTLINLARDKGADVLWDLATARPEQPFIGVRGGYGTQREQAAPNVDVIPHGDLHPVWERTRVLLIPSRHESYSMVGVEAASRGIPAVATDLPGIREALGDGAVYVADTTWGAALDHVLAHWDAYSVAAATHAHAAVDSPAELDRACLVAESLGQA